MNENIKMFLVGSVCFILGMLISTGFRPAKPGPQMSGIEQPMERIEHKNDKEQPLDKPEMSPEGSIKNNRSVIETLQ